MAQANKDENGVSTLLGTLDTDGLTTIRVEADPTTHALQVMDDTTGSDNGPGPVAPRDDNDVPALLAVSSVDGITPVAVYTDSNGNLLIQST